MERLAEAEARADLLAHLGGMVSGRLAVGSPGERSSSAKMMKLMTSSVGIAKSSRRCA